MDCDIQELLDEGNCVNCLNDSQRWSVAIALLCRISQGIPAITPTPGTESCILLESGVTDTLLLESVNDCVLLES